MGTAAGASASLSSTVIISTSFNRQILRPRKSLPNILILPWKPLRIRTPHNPRRRLAAPGPHRQIRPRLRESDRYAPRKRSHFIQILSKPGVNKRGRPCGGGQAALCEELGAALRTGGLTGFAFGEPGGDAEAVEEVAAGEADDIGCGGVVFGAADGAFFVF